MPRNSSCALCPLHLSAKQSVCVWGVGPSGAKGMVVGQGPGWQEAKFGRPFVGPTGDLLRSLLSRAGLKPDELYFTNATRCMPPMVGRAQREPSIKETNACKPYLIEEIKDVRPKVILSLGNVALRSLTGKSGVSKYRGQLHDLHKVYGEGSLSRVIPTIHPAAALRSPRYTQSIFEDILKFKAALTDGYQDIRTPWVNGPVDWVELGCPDGFVAVDIETRGLGDSSDIRLIGIDEGEGLVTVYDELHLREAIKRCVLLQKMGRRLVGHNATFFDRIVLRHHFGIDFHFDDTMLMSFLLNEEGKRNLEILATTHLGVKPWKEIDWDNMEGTTEDELATYLARDCRYTRLLANKFWSEMDPKSRNIYSYVMLPASRALREIQRRGVYISEPNLADAGRVVSGRVEELRGELTSKALLLGITKFNPNSHPHVRKLLFDKLGLPPQGKTDKDLASTDEEQLKKLQGIVDEPVLDTLLEYRKQNKLLTTYLTPYSKLRGGDGRIHPSYSVTYTVTGRTSCRGPNLQQLPRDPRIRRLVTAGPGKTLVIADYSQIELRLAAFEARETRMLQAYQEGQDVHLLMAADITGKAPEEVTKEERSRAKVSNFAFLYGGTPYTFRKQALIEHNIRLSEKEANDYYESFHRRWPGFFPWYSHVNDELKATGRVVSRLGRIRRLPNIYANGAREREEALRQAINAKVSPVASDMLMLAINRLHEEYRAAIVFEVHDSLGVEILPENDLTVSAIIKATMEQYVPAQLEKLFGATLDVPIIADIEVTPEWH